ncbi:MAG: GMC family oxidoreductase, partial [Nocardioides sp.]|nr:GMC family oxidoreductase [Nocardioides sp.]
TFDGRPACNSCGLCPAYGCPINARGDALVSFLNPAIRTGRVRVVPRAFVHRVEASADARRAVAVHYRDLDGTQHRLPATTVIVAGSPVNTARLLLLSADGNHPSGLGNSSDQLGRNIMFHNFVQGASVYPYNIRPLRSQSSTYAVDDLVGPFTGPDVSALGVPWLVGGVLQVGGGGAPLTMAKMVSAYLGYGLPLKEILKVSTHSALAGTQLIMQDLPQADNRVDLDPSVTDLHGVPAARITYSPHQHEIAASLYLGARLEAMHLLAPGSTGAIVLPYPLLNKGATGTMHLAGTARMGHDPTTSVCAPSGRLHDVENVYVADASTFPTFPGFNPTLTIMANALRIARGLATNPGE